MQSYWKFYCFILKGLSKNYIIMADDRNMGSEMTTQCVLQIVMGPTQESKTETTYPDHPDPCCKINING